MRRVEKRKLMNDYILYTNLRELPIEDFILEMAELFRSKKEHWPKECLVNPKWGLEGDISSIKLIADELTLPNEVMLR